MALSINDFFSADNIISQLDEREYEKKDIFLEASTAFARNLYQPVYIVDFYRQNFFFISGNFLYLCGITGEQLNTNVDNLYFDYVPEEEEPMLKEIISKSFELFYSFPKDERRDWTLSYYFHLCYNENKRLIQHKITPLRITEDGKLWLALCMISLSSRKDSGNVTMRRFQHQDYFYYSIAKKVWYYREGISLTDIEKDLLSMSSQGYTVKEISERICKSEDTIKAYKRKLFAKLGVKNITEAVLLAINDDLFH